ncbi:MAG: metabolite traffic protein EboE [Bauldia sp.]
MDLGRLGHLCYSTLVHPSDNWDQLWDSVNRYLPVVKKRFCPDKPFGISLRVAAKSAERLTSDRGELEKLKDFFATNGMYLFTANAFPYGSFKNERVKELVYEPDWRTDERATYTKRVADILAEIVPAGIVSSIQTPPLGFKPRVTGEDVVDAYTRQVLDVCAHLIDIENRTGKTVVLALEPEPACFLEHTSETIDYFQKRLYSKSGAAALAKATALSPAQAEIEIRKHLGTVFDICHQAVEFEDVVDSLKSLKAAGVPVTKFQIASAVRIPNVTDDKVKALKAYDDPIYFHQTVEKRNGKLTFYTDLPEAFAAYEKDPGPREWRTHFHVPVFIDDLGAFKTTRPDIEAAIALHRAEPLSNQVEIETYTWDVLPAEHKTGDINDYVVRELEWVHGELMKPAR